MFGRKHTGAADSYVRQMGMKNGNLKAPPVKKDKVKKVAAHQRTGSSERTDLGRVRVKVE